MFGGVEQFNKKRLVKADEQAKPAEDDSKMDRDSSTESMTSAFGPGTTYSRPNTPRPAQWHVAEEEEDEDEQQQQQGAPPSQELARHLEQSAQENV